MPLCESVEYGNGGKLYFVLNNNGKSVDVSSLRDAGIEASSATILRFRRSSGYCINSRD